MTSDVLIICYPPFSLHHSRYVQAFLTVGSFVSISEASSSRSRCKGLGFVVRGGREGGGVRSHFPSQRSRKWVSISLICPSQYCFCWTSKCKCQVLRLKTNRAADSSITIMNVSSPLWCFDLLDMNAAAAYVKNVMEWQGIQALTSWVKRWLFMKHEDNLK